MDSDKIMVRLLTIIASPKKLSGKMFGRRNYLSLVMVQLFFSVSLCCFYICHLESCTVYTHSGTPCWAVV